MSGGGSMKLAQAEAGREVSLRLLGWANVLPPPPQPHFPSAWTCPSYASS